MSIQSADGAPGTRYATFGTPIGIITTDCLGLSACTRAAAGRGRAGVKPATDAAAARRSAQEACSYGIVDKVIDVDYTK